MKKATMRMDENQNPIPVLGIGVGKQLTDTFYRPECAVVRLCALTDVSLWCRKPNETRTGDGLLLPAGTVEYFSMESGYGIELTGTVNLTEAGV